jgi:SGNH domain (fused to AT3 domains)
MVVLTAISLALSEWGWRREASANFYLAPTRAWELFAGSIAAFIVQKRGVQANNVLSLLGLAAIVFAVFAYDQSTPFPSVYALVPVVGVVLLVPFAEKGTLAARLLSTKLLVGIGLVSYSVYLWHQPLFVFARVRSLDAPSAPLMLSLSAVAVILGVLSWKIVEQPFRRKAQFSRRFIFSLSLFFGAAFISIGMLIAKTDIFENSFADGLNKDLQKVVDLVAFAKDKYSDFVEKWQYGKCFYGDDLDSFSFYNKEECLRLDPSRKNVLLVGDSHTAQWYFALKQNYPNVNVLQATASGCRPLIDTDGDKR